VRGDPLAPIDWLVPSLIAFAIAAACIAMVSRLLDDERIVFGRS